MLNIWDVGGQKSLRSYWRNYFESTDGLIWVVDSLDRRRIEDCKAELYSLLKEEVCSTYQIRSASSRKLMLFVYIQRLAGATLLVFANKQDVPGAMSSEEIKQVLCLCIEYFGFVTYQN